MMAAALDQALVYHQLGLCCIPIGRGTKKPPRGFKWKPFQTRRPTVAQLRKWFAGDNSLAIVCGDVSGSLVVRDFDRFDVYDRWADEYPELARTLPTVETNRGRHVYGRAKSPPRIVTLDDGELRGNGGYVLAPPSIHPNGQIYRWINPLNGELPPIDLIQVGLLPCDTEDAADTGVHRRTQDVSKGVRADRSSSPSLSLSPSSPPTTPAQCLVPSVSHSTAADAIEAAIVATLPNRVGHRHHQVFQLCRALRAVSSLKGASFSKLKPEVRRWHDRAKQRVEMDPFDEVWADFIEGWPRVKHPAGSEPIREIFARAVAAPLPAAALQYDLPAPRWLVALCRQLQREKGNSPFFLAARAAADVLKIHHATVSRWLKVLQADGVLKLVSKGGHDQHKASEYRYIADL